MVERVIVGWVSACSIIFHCTVFRFTTIGENAVRHHATYIYFSCSNNNFVSVWSLPFFAFLFLVLSFITNTLLWIAFDELKSIHLADEIVRLRIGLFVFLFFSNLLSFDCLCVCVKPQAQSKRIQKHHFPLCNGLLLFHLPFIHQTMSIFDASISFLLPFCSPSLSLSLYCNVIFSRFHFYSNEWPFAPIYYPIHNFIFAHNF